MVKDIVFEGKPDAINLLHKFVSAPKESYTNLF
jgi:hypothetical protein